MIVRGFPELVPRPHGGELPGKPWRKRAALWFPRQQRCRKAIFLEHARADWSVLSKDLERDTPSCEAGEKQTDWEVAVVETWARELRK